MTAFEDISYGREGLAPYSSFADQSRGRLFEEAASPTRTPFQRDRDRIIHSTAFRRLKHKTQVFVHHVGDHYRTRLTHSIEVSQIARSLARALKVDEDLAECLALCHDFGHTPFGHAGEETLDELMKPWGGFDHNAQSLRIVTELEQQYAEFDGLNLSWETLEGLVKHNGPLVGDDVSEAILKFNSKFDLELSSHAGIEAQCAAVADDIAYNAHDLDDGLRAGLFDLDDLREVPIAGETLKKIRLQYPDLEEKRIRHEIVRHQITAMVEDVIVSSIARIGKTGVESVSDVRACGKTLVTFGSQMASREKSIKAFLFERMYRAAEIMRVRDTAEKIIRELFDCYMNDEKAVPENLQKYLAKKQNTTRSRVIADFIASMTDSYAINEHQRLFDHKLYLG